MGDLGDEDMERIFWQFTTLISLFERNPMFAQNEWYLNIPQVYDGGRRGRYFKPILPNLRRMEPHSPGIFT